MPEAEPAPSPIEEEVISSEELFKGKRQVGIRHGTQLYRLQITKAGKLILVK